MLPALSSQLGRFREAEELETLDVWITEKYCCSRMGW